MIYSKPPLTINDQADLLISRGFIADKEKLLEYLRYNNYYRLTGYLYPFRRPDERYSSSINLEKILTICEYDQKLRNHLLSAIDKIEVSFRSVIAYHFSMANGPFAYTDKSALPELEDYRRIQLIENIHKETERSREEFIRHFMNKYGDIHKEPPLWMAVEIMTFGSIVSLYRGVSNSLKQTIAKDFGVPDQVLSSWIVGINSIRNICAHHSRLYNRRLGYSFKLPRERKHPEWFSPVRISNSNVFTALTICNYLLSVIGAGSSWSSEIKDLFDKYESVPEIKNTFPRNWQQSKLWT
ncbi:MAG: Abi family protein [Spirochaetales bacterium]|uniref:Abi family protein n=1 Tax=Candidatus Thalassospirochaeta sargassi TaxID=3119039 RepID=A0AAJ1MNY5_9SPIO|nr:Abi family protein [Spirochaetales bacterium]